jgi:hypothetical protein
MPAILLNLRNSCVHLFSFVLLLSAILVATVQKGVSKLSTLFASSPAPPLPSSPLPSATIEPEQVIKMGEDIKAVITDQTFIHAWFIIVGVLGAVVLAAVLALLTKRVMNVVGTVLAVFTAVALEQRPAGSHDEHKEIEAEEQDKDKEEIAKLMKILHKNQQTIAAKDRALVCKEQELIFVKIEVKNLKGIIQQQKDIIQENTETIAATAKDLACAKAEVKKLKSHLRKANATETGAYSAQPSMQNTVDVSLSK